jgi:hypothetical protein
VSDFPRQQNPKKVNINRCVESTMVSRHLKKNTVSLPAVHSHLSSKNARIISAATKHGSSFTPLPSIQRAEPFYTLSCKRNGPTNANHARSLLLTPYPTSSRIAHFLNPPCGSISE